MKPNILSVALVCILLIGALSGCGNQKAISLVNTLAFDIGDFQSIRLDYDADDIYVLKSESDKVVLKEYMNEDKKNYYARTTIQNGELLITEGDRPRRSGFESYIELCIPQDYSDSLSLHSTSGTVDTKIPLNLSGNFSVDTTSGMINVSDIKASAINITTTSGRAEGKGFTASALKIVSTSGNLTFDTIDMDTIYIQSTSANTTINHANGSFTYKSTGGKLAISDITGYGSFNASGEGSIKASFTDVTGDISAYSKNGSLTFGLPSQLEFKFSATTREGSIDTSFADLLAVTGNTAAGIVGSSPTVSIELETRNGDIKVSRL
ncbi:DUF4097 family beta strand repeat-containing protein [Desulfosporosinus shakirovi]|uniref:DUF4097 family beta strand repeat-containing protein n=1 Tax=Desulfosporosinus shakirovi TaxID=2885154 RepID=UPI001E545DE0|nr:DUF4097 family beta strand repeat-containing protein [Desulfosporosinus sp. SRJS8]MCB8815304.1 DUF4097 domain-containing protein [Desulfosporosinus sp. SRJS8]